MSSNHDDLSARLRRSLDHGAAPELSPELVSGAAARPAPHVASPGRALRVAGGAGLAGAAITVGALVVVPVLSPRAPLFTAASAASQPAALGTQEGISSDMKIGWWVNYQYTADPSLSTEGGRGQVYRLVIDGGDPEQRTADLSAALGVDGTPVKADYSDATYPTWVVGPQDGTATNLSFSAYGTGDWWYNDPAAMPIYICDPSVLAEQATEYGCVLPADAPANLAPVGDDARAQAAALFAATGYSVDAASIELYSDDWGTTATAYLTVEGQRTALAWNVNWSNTGALSYAYGHSVSVESAGTFDTVSPAAAVDRLAEGRWYGSAGPDFQGGMVAYASDLAREDVAVGEPAPDGATTDAPAPDAPVTDVPDTPVSPDDPTQVPVDPMPEPTPETVQVTVDNATATLLLLWDADGNAWLVPGYAMQMDEGWWNAVVSLVDGVIALPEPIEVDPAVLEPGVSY
ncbi:MAG: hypothetical protein ACKVOG_04880 [Rhodoglobus sp.]